MGSAEWQHYPYHSGHLHVDGNPLWNEWYYRGHATLHGTSDFRVAVRDTHEGRRALAGCRTFESLGAIPNHLAPDGSVAGANFVYNDGSAAWNHAGEFRYYWQVPSDRAGHVTQGLLTRGFDLPGDMQE